MTSSVSRTEATAHSSDSGSSSVVARMTRRLLTLVVVVGFAASAFASTAEASILGCNAPNLVPASQAPPQWAQFAPFFCIHRTTARVNGPGDIAAAHKEGFWWCFAWSQKPSGPAGGILNWFTAARFCSSRAWYYVQVVT